MKTTLTSSFPFNFKKAGIVMLSIACFSSMDLIAQNDRGGPRNRGDGQGNTRQSTRREPSVGQQTPGANTRQGPQGNSNRNDITRGQQNQDRPNREMQGQSNRDIATRGNDNRSRPSDRNNGGNRETPGRNTTRDNVTNRPGNNTNQRDNNYNRPGNNSQRGNSYNRPGNSNRRGNNYNRPGNNYNNGNRNNGGYYGNNNYRRPAYSAYNPNWRYSYAPRRNSVYNYLPSSYININFGGFGYRYYDGIYYRPYNNIFRVVAPPIGIYINVLPIGYRRVYVRDYPYYYYNGTYYDYRDNNYTVVSPPVGAIVESIPDGYTTLTVEGETYYEVDGAQYKPVVQENGEIWYEVIKSN